MEERFVGNFNPGYFAGIKRGSIGRTGADNEISKAIAAKRAALRRKAKEESDAGR